MSTNDAANPRRSRYRWGTIAVGAAIGLAYLIAGWLGDNLAFGLFGLVVMLLTTVIFLVVGRFSETSTVATRESTASTVKPQLSPASA
jgi:hypothetical protein